MIIGVEVIRHYYPALSERQIRQFTLLNELYSDWNAKINVISRKDIENLYVHHVLHSLGIEKMIRFKADTSVMDVGTGGGFPGIPLAILFPEVSFYLIDSVGKKIKVAQAVADAAGLTNVATRHCRVEEEKGKFDFIVSRAVMPLPQLVARVKKNVRREQCNALPNGLICLKGGDLQSEIAPFRSQALDVDLSDYFKEPFFDTKKVIYIPL
ncbi:MAG: 16S rRNA (guanine(527)-N(7))-methyltransferase RsmG [Tannerella sp.]|jgi:16S rRNA (guanine527-N7)-methyltransferase|nr:16S rRNA (guanine(527)-N(7))-methyltransferase RsmG [Tannerella sp.]